MSEQLNLAKPVMSRKKFFILMAIGSLLMTAGFVWKSGLIGRIGAKAASAYEAMEIKKQAEENARLAKERSEKLREAHLEHLKMLPADDRAAAEFRGFQKALVLQLKPDRWSRKVMVPGDRHLKFWLDVEPKGSGYYIWFEEDKDPIEVGSVPLKFGQKKGTFWVLGKTANQTMRVEVELIPKTVQDLKSPW